MSENVYNGRYRIESKLGDGGMAVVYSGTDILLRRRVAIKVLREQYAADEDFVRRFYHEAQSAAKLSHPNVVNVYDVGREGETYYIVMELVDGTTLAELVAGGHKLPEPVAIDFAAQICNGLAYAHRQGLLHRDIKPANILVTKDDVVKISDFGIARAVSQHTLTVTQPGMVMGSIAYLSPEQAQGHDLHETSDLYSLGIVLYQMLTGRLPFTGESPITVALKHISEPPPPLDTAGLGVSPALAAVVRRLLQKSPEGRFASASEVASALRAARERPMVATTAEGPPAPPGDAPTVIVPAIAPPPRPSRFPDNGMQRRSAVRETARNPRTSLVWIGFALLLAVGIAAGYFAVTQRERDAALHSMIALPNEVGRRQAEAEQALHNLHLTPKITPVASETAGAGIVVKQNPAAGTMLPPGETVELQVSNGLPIVDAPDVRTYSRDDALKILAKAKLNAKIVLRYDGKTVKDTVIDQRPAAGARLREKSLVTLVVSNGAQPSTVPNVVSMTVDAARATLAKANLSLEIIERQAIESVPADTIASQDPNPGARVDSGTKISVVVSTGPSASGIPDVGGKSLRDATAALTGAGFVPVVTYSVQGGDGVISQDPAPGTSATRGTKVKIFVAVPGTVPDVAGMSLPDARAALISAGYKIGNTALTQEGEEGKVVRTEPEANSQLRPNESVIIYYNPPGGPK